MTSMNYFVISHLPPTRNRSVTILLDYSIKLTVFQCFKSQNMCRVVFRDHKVAPFGVVIAVHVSTPLYDSISSMALVPWTGHCMEDERQMLNGYLH